LLVFNHDAFAKIRGMAKQKFRPTRLGGFSGAKAYTRYVEVLKKRRNAVGRTFCDAINHETSNKKATMSGRRRKVEKQGYRRQLPLPTNLSAPGSLSSPRRLSELARHRLP
jgi:hypothetical protein